MVNITYKKYCILIDIYDAGKKLNEFTLSDLAREINKYPEDSYLQAVCKVLIQQGILVYSHSEGRNNYYKINLKKLENFIRNQEPFKYTGKFIVSSVKGYSF